jgi:hypothetical protein
MRSCSRMTLICLKRCINLPRYFTLDEENIRAIQLESPIQELHSEVSQFR